jgi:hypothetical protein
VTDQGERCAWCSGPLVDPANTSARARRNRLTCSNRCRKARNRELKQREISNHSRAHNVTPGYAQFDEPPRPGGSLYQASLGDERFHRQLAREGTQAPLLTAADRAAQRRNPGVQLPHIQQKILDHELAQRQADAADHARAIVAKVEDPYDPSSLGSVAAQGARSRQRNRPQEPYRTGRNSGPDPWSEEPQCITSPWGRNTPRHMMG